MDITDLTLCKILENTNTIQKAIKYELNSINEEDNSDLFVDKSTKYQYKYYTYQYSESTKVPLGKLPDLTKFDFETNKVGLTTTYLNPSVSIDEVEMFTYDPPTTTTGVNTNNNNPIINNTVTLYETYIYEEEDFRADTVNLCLLTPQLLETNPEKFTTHLATSLEGYQGTVTNLSLIHI